MMSLVKKDLALVRGGIIWLGLFAAVFCFLFIDGSNYVMCIVAPVLFSSLASTSFAWDDQCQWNVFAVSSGIDRKEIVRSKYVSSALVIPIGAVIGAVIAVAVTLGDGLDLASIAVNTLTGIVLSVVIFSIGICVNYVTGNSIRAQYLSIIILMVSVIALVSGTVFANSLLGGGMAVILAFLVAVMAAVVLVTYRISCDRFLKRDL